MTADPLADILQSAIWDWEAQVRAGMRPPPELTEQMARVAREHIAAEIEAANATPKIVMDPDFYCRQQGMARAARIARGQS